MLEKSSVRTHVTPGDRIAIDSWLEENLWNWIRDREDDRDTFVTDLIRQVLDQMKEKYRGA